MRVRVYQRGARWWVDYLWQGARVRKPVAATRTEADTEASKIVLADAEGKFPGPEVWHRKDAAREVRGEITFRGFAKEYLRIHAASKKAWVFYHQTVTVLDRHFGETPLRSIRAKEAEECIAARRAVVKPSTANRTLTVAKHMMRKAVEWGYVDSNPFAGLRLERERNGRERFLDRAEAETLLGTLPTYLRPVVLAALHTGARRGELLKLTWADVDLPRRRVTFRGTKNGEDRTVTLSERLAAVLQRLEGRLLGGAVFLNTEGKPLTAVALRKPFEDAARKAGLGRLRFHDLRHTAISWLVQANVPLATIREVSGHKSLAMLQRYAHHAPAHLAIVAAVMDARPESQGETGTTTGTTANATR